MFFFRRRAASAKPKSTPRSAIEPLEQRRLLSASLLHSAGALTESHASATHVTYQHVSGTVVSTDATANTITISSTASTATPSTQSTYTVSSTATITANGKSVTLGMLTAGVKVALRVTTGTPPEVTSIHAISAHAAGTVTAVDTTNNTITLTPRGGGTAVTYTIPAAATITINGAASTLSSIAVGSAARITFSAFSGTTIISVSALSLSASKILHRYDSLYGSAAQAQTGFGTVVSLSTTSNTITVASGDPNHSTQTTYALASGATITADGKTATLGSLIAGDQVSSTLNTATPAAVTAIVATGARVDGSVTAVDTTADTITLTPDNGGTSTTYTIPTTATITVDGVAGALSGITAGSHVDIQLSALSSTTVLSVSANSQPSGGLNLHAAMGTLVSSTATTITLSNSCGGSSTATTTTYTLGTGATVTADGVASTLASLAVGDQIALTLSTTTPTTVTAIAATGKRVDGAVSAVDTTAGTITLAAENGGTATTYTIPAGATITVDGAAGTLAGITVNSHVSIQYSATDGTTIVSVTDSAHDDGQGGFGGPGGFGGHGPGDGLPGRQLAFGTVVSVNTTANTVTVSNSLDHLGGATQTTYTLASSATITLDGKTVALSGLVAGDEVALTFSTGTPVTVTSIVANSPSTQSSGSTTSAASEFSDGFLAGGWS